MTLSVITVEFGLAFSECLLAPTVNHSPIQGMLTNVLHPQMRYQKSNSDTAYDFVSSIFLFLNNFRFSEKKSYILVSSHVFLSIQPKAKKLTVVHCNSINCSHHWHFSPLLQDCLTRKLAYCIACLSRLPVFFSSGQHFCNLKKF